MSAIHDLLRDLEAFDKTPESYGYDLRLDLAEIVLRHLSDKGWTQKQFADAARMKSPFITRITHAANNCTFDVAGRLLFALGVKAKLVEVERLADGQWKPVQTISRPVTLKEQGTAYGKIEKERTTKVRVTTTAAADFTTQSGRDVSRLSA